MRGSAKLCFTHLRANIEQSEERAVKSRHGAEWMVVD